MSERAEWQALVDEDLWLLPKEALIASVKALASRLLELSPGQDRYWHGYQAAIPEVLEDRLGAVMAFTIIPDSPRTREEAPQTHLGTVFGYELTFKYLCTWDHEPSTEEREQVQLDQLAKETKERNDNAGNRGEP